MQNVHAFQIKQLQMNVCRLRSSIVNIYFSGKIFSKELGHSTILFLASKTVTGLYTRGSLPDYTTNSTR